MYFFHFRCGKALTGNIPESLKDLLSSAWPRLISVFFHLCVHSVHLAQRQQNSKPPGCCELAMPFRRSDSLSCKIKVLHNSTCNLMCYDCGCVSGHMNPQSVAHFPQQEYNNTKHEGVCTVMFPAMPIICLQDMRKLHGHSGSLVSCYSEDTWGLKLLQTQQAPRRTGQEM